MGNITKAKFWIGIAAGMAGLASAGTITIDATSGSSIKMGTATCTSTSATVSWTYNKANGIWRLYYGITNVAPPTVSGWPTYTGINGKGGTMTINLTGLTAGTRYYATLAGWEGGASNRAQSYAHMSFTTEAGPSQVLDRTAPAARTGQGYDASGRRMGRIPASAVQFTSQGAGIRIQR